MRFTTILLACAMAMPAMADNEAPKDSVEGFVFTDIITVPTTSVKNQNKSGTCWSFSGTSFLEDEVLHRGGADLDVSEMYTVRQCYRDKAERYVRMYGKSNFAGGGAISDVIYVWRKYGAVPEEAYPGLNYGEDKHVHGELDAVLEAYVNAVVGKRNGGKISSAWLRGIDGILDAYLGEVPETFTYQGKTYTPESYAKSLGLNLDDYAYVTSFTHHPFYESFILEIPDNWLYDRYYNVPMMEMKAIVDRALEMGYTVGWAADVSEKGFKWNDGVALMPREKTAGDLEGTELARWVKLSDREKQNEAYNFTGPVDEIEVTQELRQEMFDNQLTTDDHGMVIMGVATDQNGKRYYKVKNSWDTTQKYGGYIYVSEPYFLAKTLNITVNKAAMK